MLDTFLVLTGTQSRNAARACLIHWPLKLGSIKSMYKPRGLRLWSDGPARVHSRQRFTAAASSSLELIYAQFFSFSSLRSWLAMVDAGFEASMKAAKSPRASLFRAIYHQLQFVTPRGLPPSLRLPHLSPLFSAPTISIFASPLDLFSASLRDLFSPLPDLLLLHRDKMPRIVPFFSGIIVASSAIYVTSVALKRDSQRLGGSLREVSAALTSSEGRNDSEDVDALFLQQQARNKPSIGVVDATKLAWNGQVESTVRFIQHVDWTRAVKDSAAYVKSKIQSQVENS